MAQHPIGAGSVDGSCVMRSSLRFAVDRHVADHNLAGRTALVTWFVVGWFKFGACRT